MHALQGGFDILASPRYGICKGRAREIMLLRTLDVCDGTTLQLSPQPLALLALFQPRHISLSTRGRAYIDSVLSHLSHHTRRQAAGCCKESISCVH
ncbi:hypothetical protein CERSUDRAFT_120134 [Gelatoporia subvermispora B]|uniref:Uncharacterized protein n=1 Tax=Ceriporiopsis subvermispora (strain B) TaxID=914234 RepID=M2QYT6_CERS8|nr:hypothetical protein CERSUDRAFT_120134 [Gelatoporia subvermispora B]